MSQPESVNDLVEAFYRIAKRPHDPFTKAFLSQFQSHTVKVDGKFYKYFERGSGPTVLHVHGVHGNLGSMVGVAAALLEQNYRVVLFDAPAHGEALGTSTDPVEVRGMIRGLCDRLGDLHAVVCHSLGGMWALSALGDQVRTKACVTISVPTGKKFLVERFAEFNKLDDNQVQGLIGEIEARFGDRVWSEFSTLEAARAIEVPGLIVHGSSDDYVPPDHAKELHSSWPQSTLKLIEGVGHVDILKSTEMLKSVVRYLQEVK